MIIILSSPKAGNGTSTTAALLALTAAHEQSTVLVDLAGDQPTILESPAIDGVIYIQPRLELINAARMTLAEQIDMINAIDTNRKTTPSTTTFPATPWSRGFSGRATSRSDTQE
jgi:Mrp family chromosome partitioning ATPase